MDEKKAPKNRVTIDKNLSLKTYDMQGYGYEASFWFATNFVFETKRGVKWVPKIALNPYK
ncbi:hypothetical protein OAA99_02130 [Omnitrophica bacterium]|nr:hypothetical protein [Candidatus Omnitrophota bacterium]